MLSGSTHTKQGKILDEDQRYIAPPGQPDELLPNTRPLLDQHYTVGLFAPTNGPAILLCQFQANGLLYLVLASKIICQSQPFRIALVKPPPRLPKLYKILLLQRS